MGTMRATRRFAIAGKPLPVPGTEPLAIDLPAGPTYAAVLGLRVIDGRWISERDRLESPPVVVISESFAKQHFPGERAVGHRCILQRPPDRTAGTGAEIVACLRRSAVRYGGARAPQSIATRAGRWTFTSFFVAPRAIRSVMASLPRQ